MALKKGTKIDKTDALPVSFRFSSNYVEMLEALSEYSGKKKTQVIETLLKNEFDSLMKNNHGDLSRAVQKVKSRKKR